MRQQSVTQGALGSSSWMFVDSRRNQDFQLGLAATLDSTANLTYDVDLTLDENTKERWQRCTIARVTTTATVTLVDHGLNTGDSVVIFNTNANQSNPEPNLEGTFDVTVVDDDTFTYTVADTGQTSAEALLISFRVVKHATLAAETTEQQGSQLSPVEAVRLNVTVFVAGSATLTVLQQG